MKSLFMVNAVNASVGIFTYGRNNELRKPVKAETSDKAIEIAKTFITDSENYMYSAMEVVCYEGRYYPVLLFEYDIATA